MSNFSSCSEGNVNDFCNYEMAMDAYEQEQEELRAEDNARYDHRLSMYSAIDPEFEALCDDISLHPDWQGPVRPFPIHDDEPHPDCDDVPF